MRKEEKSSVLRVIAEKAQVSVSTVSIVLNNRGDQMRISKATQHRIQEIARAENYTPNIYARKLRKSAQQGANKVIGVFWSLHSVNESMGWFFSNAHRENEQNHYQVEFSIHFFRPGCLSDMEELRDPWRFNGLLVFGLRDEDARFLAEQKMEIPIVISRNFPYGNINCVFIDNQVVGSRAAEELAAHGYSRVGVIKEMNATNGANSRSEGFVRRAGELGLKYMRQWCLELDNSCFQAASGSIERLLSLPEHPDALFVTNQGCALNTAVTVNHWKQQTGGECALVFCSYDAGIEAMVDNVAIIDLSTGLNASQSMRLIWQLMNEKSDAPVCLPIPPMERMEKLKDVRAERR